MSSQDLPRLGLVVAFSCQFSLTNLFKIYGIVMKIKIDVDRILLVLIINAHFHLLYKLPNLKQKILCILETNMYRNLRSIKFANL